VVNNQVFAQSLFNTPESQAYFGPHSMVRLM